MRFIKENLFLLVLIAGTIVLGGAMLAADFSVGDQVITEIAARKGLSSRLGTFLSRGNLVNERVVAAEADRVRLIVEEANEIVQALTRANREPYKVLLLPLREGGQVKQLVPAFPYDANTFRYYGLNPEFIRIHPGETANRIDALMPTRPPTQEEVTSQLRLLLASAGTGSGESTGRLTAPGGGAAVPPAAPSLEASASLATQYSRKAFDYAVYEQATRGRVYVDDLVIYEITFRPSETVADEATLWRKQYKLWIATDVVEAIQAANDEVLSRLPVRDRNVCNAPVKRWSSFKVSNEYSNNRSESTGGGQVPSFSPPPGDAGPAGGDTSAPQPTGGFRASGMTAPPPDSGMRGGFTGGGAFQMPVGGGPSAYLTASALVTGETCTQRYTDQDKDVVQYSFQVVMPSRHVSLLLRKLESGRMHTVLAYRAEEVPRDPRYFYSNDPVMQMTFTCEALFLTSWERDLMPPMFLYSLPDSALRPQDRKRMGK